MLDHMNSGLVDVDGGTSDGVLSSARDGDKAIWVCERKTDRLLAVTALM